MRPARRQFTDEYKRPAVMLLVCKSARRPNADRPDKLLIHLELEGSKCHPTRRRCIPCRAAWRNI